MTPQIFYILCRIIFGSLNVNFEITDSIINVLQSFFGALLTTLLHIM